MKHRTWYQRLLAMFYPERCCCCGRVIACGELVCSVCFSKLTEVEPPLCLHCGYQLEHCQCRNTHIRREYVQCCTAPFYYEGAARDAVLRMKLRGHPEAGELLVDAMVSTVKGLYHGVDFDYVTTVPIHTQTRRERGYDQSEVLARGVAKQLGLPFCTALVKLWESAPQRSLPAYRRSGNVLGIFDRCGTVPTEGRVILLVDDVCTTGATMDECAKMLRIGGARAVYGISAALATPKDIR